MKALEIIVSIITIIGFIITVWQLVSFKKRLVENSEEAKKTQRQLIHLSKVSDAIRLIELVQENLLNLDNKIALYRSLELKKALNEIDEDDVLRKNVRENYNKLIISFTERVSNLQTSLAKNEVYDNKYLLETLLGISDNLQLVQRQLKK